MSDAAATDGIASDSCDGASAALTPEAIEGIVADFRTWLTDLAKPPVPLFPAPELTADLFGLIGQFTALRHEVNMQTRAARAAVEQNADLLKELKLAAAPEAGAQLRTLAKALIDIADALSLSLRQMEKFQERAQPLLEKRDAGSPGFFSRLFGSRPASGESISDSALDKLGQLVAAAADGYAMSLRRVEKLLPALELERQACIGEPFDPETMEAVEVVGDSERAAGTVIDEVRPGYLWRGKIFRFALVKVAR
jgi:molecular chaperone GrpE